MHVCVCACVEQEAAADDVRVEIMQSVAMGHEELPAWARAGGGAFGGSGSESTTSASVWDVLLDECTGPSGSNDTVAALLQPLDGALLELWWCW